jgi:hypothetical protein
MLNIDNYWLDDRKLANIRHQVPSTEWGKELMRDAWPKMFQQLCSSETYRGYAIVISVLCSHMRRGISIGEIEKIIESVDRSVKTSRTFTLSEHLLGAAGLAITNAWERCHCGITTDQIAASYESELIYTAKMFNIAREHEIAGRKLP